MNNQLESLVNKIRVILSNHSRLPAGIARVGDSFGNTASKEQYESTLKHFLTLNKDTLGVGIWFEPYKYKAGQKYFGPYVYKDKEKKVLTYEYSTKKYNYPKWEWYTIGANTDKQVVWTDPYYDEHTGITMITTTAPFYDTAQKFSGVTTGDIDLTNMQKIISGMEIGTSGGAFLLGKDGKFIAHRDSKKVMKIKITEDTNESLKKLGMVMLKNKTGIGHFNNENGRNRVYYSHLTETGWTLGIIIAENELYASLNRLLIYFIIIIAVALPVSSFLTIIASRKITGPIVSLTEDVKILSSGDLTLSLKTIEDGKTARDELELLILDFALLVKNLKTTIFGVIDVSHNLVSSSLEMSTTTTAFSDNAQSQAVTAEEVTATIEQISAGMDIITVTAEDQSGFLLNLIKQIKELTESINEMGSVINEALSYTKTIASEAREGEESLKTMNQSMSKISESSGDVTTTIDMITGISEQINLLALNAAIEAARAGDAGRGFAVVADEISKLADQTASSIKDINNLIKASDDEVSRGMDSIMNSIAKISSIIEGVNSITEVMTRVSRFMEKEVEINRAVNSEADKVQYKSDEIKNATQEQKIAVAEIVKSISSINELTQANAAGALEMADNSEDVAQMAETLKEKVDYFKV
ncbi:MAG: hypothetical protein GY754_13910 [bacterium]|nr:hypothetical protein [bacterium]